MPVIGRFADVVAAASWPLAAASLIVFIVTIDQIAGRTLAADF